MALTAARTNFYTERLSPRARAIFERCVDNLERGVLLTSFDIDGSENGSDLATAVVEAVLCGCPELFFVDQQTEISQNGSTLSIRFNDKYGDVQNKAAALEREVERIAAKVGLCTGVYNKIARINKYLTARVAAANGTESTLGDAYGALILKSARCEGYAKAAKLIMDRVGIRSVIALGEVEQNGSRTPHAWNIAYIGDKPFGFDFSWCASGSVEGVPGVDYMFLPDGDMHIDHFPKYAYPECTDPSQTYWARNNGFVKYRPDLARVKAVAVDKNFVCIVRFDDAKTAKQLKGDVPDYLVGEMYAKGKSFSRVANVYNERLRTVTVFFIND